MYVYKRGNQYTSSLLVKDGSIKPIIGSSIPIVQERTLKEITQNNKTFLEQLGFKLKN